jgi:PAS domain S-box-containing protein
MLDGVDEAVVVLDDDGRVTYANETAADLLGCPTSDLVGRDPFRGDSAVASTEVAARCRAAMETEEREAFEAYCEPLDAWLAVRPVPVEQGLVVYLRDVTDQRASARAVRLQEQRLRAVFESTSDVMVMKDREGRYQLVNGAAASALDRPKSDVLGRTDRELFGPDVGEQMRERDRTVLETERSTTDEETLPTADGDRVYRATRVPYYGPDGDLAGVICVCRDVTDRKARERELRRYETLVETTPDTMFALDTDLTVTLVSGSVEELTGYDRGTLTGVPVPELRDWGIFDEDDFDDALDNLRRLVDDDRDFLKVEVAQYDADSDRIEAEYHMASVPGTVDCEGGVVGTIRDITDHKRQARQIRRQRDELDTLNRINALVHEIIQGLLDATSRGEIERTVCSRLADSDLYCNAWVADRDVDGDVTVRTGVGDDEYFDAVEAGDASGGGVVDVLSTGESLVVDDLLDDDCVPEFVREEAAARNHRSCVVVPITHADASYGALVVNAARPDAFSDRERAAFEVLGETAGFAVDAVQNRQLLLGDNLVEYRFHISNSDAFLFRLSERLDCTCTLEWTVPTDGDRALHYVTVLGADLDDVLAAATDADHVRDVRLLGGGDRDDALFEIELPNSATATLLRAGVNPVEVVLDSGTANVVVEAPPTVDAGTVVDAFVASPDDTELVAKREVGRPARTAQDFRAELADRLTDRQRAALRAAYHGGYFEWPRESTAEEVADSLGVASATLHYHLRHAQRALLGAFLDE